MKTTLLSLIACMFTFCAAFGQDNNCLKKMRTGNFKYDVRGDDVIIVRTKKTQTEYINSGKSKLVLKIKWLSDSVYVLKQKKAVNVPGCLHKGDEIVVKITRCYGNKYDAEYTTKKCGDGASTFIRIE